MLNIRLITKVVGITAISLGERTASKVVLPSILRINKRSGQKF